MVTRLTAAGPVACFFIDGGRGPLLVPGPRVAGERHRRPHGCRWSDNIELTDGLGNDGEAATHLLIQCGIAFR